jgi:predicted lipoprotein with Yx(FWY)xxD motif
MKGTWTRGIAILVVAIAVVAVILGYKYGSSNKVETFVPRTVVKVRSTTRYGDILVTTGGFTLYTYKLDEKNHSECETFCLHVWPPFTVPDGVRPVGEGAMNLGTILRSNGERQVTYQGMPLYRYVYDHYPGRVLGDSGWWSVVRVSSADA